MKSLLVLFVVGASLFAASPSTGGATLPGSLQVIPETLDSLVNAGVIVGAQVAISHGDQLVLSHAAGTKAVPAKDPVSTDTLFLIASCSKPFASATVLRMQQTKAYNFTLTDTIDRWLPVFGAATIDGGGAANRAPTIAELLCHRAGIFSQKVKITRAQSQLIYTFDKTLEAGVNEIAAQPLLAQPGERYAYSGAGYCVLGRVTELIAGDDQSFEELLQQCVCAPLGLTRTTYFPGGRFNNFATGFAADQAPHTLGDKHLWPLIGGSLYSTAEEMVRFAQGVAGFVKTTDGEPFFDADTWRELKVERNPGQGYSLGWSTLRSGGRLVRFSHSGSLQGYRSYVAFDRENQTCVAATYTLTNPRGDAEASAKIREALKRVLNESW